MGRGRGRTVALAFTLAALTAAVSGCGADENVNESRPQPPTRVSVAITPTSITVQPQRIAIGPEPSKQIPQNQHAGQPPMRSDEPVDVVFVAANLTDFDSRLVVRGAKTHDDVVLVANGNGSLQTSLPTGVYRLSAADIPGAKPVRFAVGSYRSSSQNDVLLP
jgi:hypothetical protein